MKTGKYIFVATILVLIVTGCGTSTKFAARKYTKGYFADVAGAVPSVVSREGKHSITKPAVIAPAKKVTVLTQRPVVATTKPVEKHTSIAVAHSAKKIIKALPPVVAEPLVNAVSGISTYGNSHSDSKESTTHFSRVSVIIFLSSILVVVLAVVAIFITAPVIGLGAFGIFAVGLLIAFVFDLVAVIFAIVAIASHEENITGAAIVLFINIFSLLLILIAQAKG